MAHLYPNLVTLETLEQSFEKRNMDLVKISKNPSANNSVLFIDAGEILYRNNSSRQYRSSSYDT